MLAAFSHLTRGAQALVLGSTVVIAFSATSYAEVKSADISKASSEVRKELREGDHQVVADLKQPVAAYAVEYVSPPATSIWQADSRPMRNVVMWVGYPVSGSVTVTQKPRWTKGAYETVQGNGLKVKVMPPVVRGNFARQLAEPSDDYVISTSPYHYHIISLKREQQPMPWKEGKDAGTRDIKSTETTVSKPVTPDLYDSMVRERTTSEEK